MYTFLGTYQVAQRQLLPSRDAPSGRVRGRWWGWAAVLFLLYAAFSLTRHDQLITGGFDLGIFTQAVHGYANLGFPRSDIKGWGFNLFGDHFHPIIVLLVPVYWLWASPGALLVSQAALIAIGVVPLARIAEKRLGKPAARAVAASYGLSFGVQGALAFDFHEVSFAVPLLAFGLTALIEKRWRAAVWWIAPLLLVKEELSLTVAAVGAVLVWRGQRRAGLALIGVSLISFAIVVGILIPSVHPLGIYPYLSHSSAGGSLSSERTLLERLLALPLLMVSPKEKLITLVLLSALTGAVAFFSRLTLIIVPSILIRFLSDSPAYWGIEYQYNLILMPILFAAALDAQPRLLSARIALVRWLGKNMGAAMLCAAAPFAPGQPLQAFILHPADAISSGKHPRVAHAMLAEIPDGAVVEATNHLSAHLAHRTRVYLWPYTDRRADWVIYDFTDPWPSHDEKRGRLGFLMAEGYKEVRTEDAIVLLRRDGTP